MVETTWMLGRQLGYDHGKRPYEVDELNLITTNTYNQNKNHHHLHHHGQKEALNVSASWRRWQDRPVRLAYSSGCADGSGWQRMGCRVGRSKQIFPMKSNKNESRLRNHTIPSLELHHCPPNHLPLHLPLGLGFQVGYPSDDPKLHRLVPTEPGVDGANDNNHAQPTMMTQCPLLGEIFHVIH